MSNWRHKLLRIIGLGDSPPPIEPAKGEAEAEFVSQCLEHEIKRHKRVQTKLQSSTLNEIDHNMGVRMAVRGVLHKLERERQK